MRLPSQQLPPAQPAQKSNQKSDEQHDHEIAQRCFRVGRRQQVGNNLRFCSDEIERPLDKFGDQHLGDTAGKKRQRAESIGYPVGPECPPVQPAHRRCHVSCPLQRSAPRRWAKPWPMPEIPTLPLDWPVLPCWPHSDRGWPASLPVLPSYHCEYKVYL